MIEPRTTTIQQLAERWSWKPEQIIDAAIEGQIGLYFWFDGNIHDPAKGGMHEEHYQGFLQANADILRAMIATGSSQTMTAILEGKEVVVSAPKTGPQEWRVPGQRPSPIEMMLSAYKTIKIDNLHALMDEVKAHEKTPPAPAPANQDGREAPAPVADSASNAPGWSLTRPKRFTGYTEPMYRLLAAAHRDGKTCPTARDVLEAWRTKKPAEIAQVLAEGFDFYDANGNTKAASLAAISKVIKRMTGAR